MITLREMTIDDLPFMLEIRNDPETRQWLHNDDEFSLDQSQKWFRRTVPQWFIIKFCNQSIGYFRTFDWDKDRGMIRIGADIHKEYRGRGLAIPAYKELFRTLIKQGFRHFWLEVLANNERAVHVYKQLGFKVVGRQVNAVQRGSKQIDSIVMAMVTDRTSGRDVKVVCTFCGSRRKKPVNQEQALAMMRYLLEMETAVDPGCPMDTIIVHNEDRRPAGYQVSKPFKRFLKLLHSANGQSTARGTLRVYHRENVGLSFAAYNYAYQFHRDLYDYWLFTEDDHVFLQHGYMARAVEQLQARPLNGFVAMVGIQDKKRYANKLHAHGGVGVMAQTMLKKICERNGHLPFILSRQYRDHEHKAEIPFTNTIVQLGFQLVNYSGGKACVSWEQNWGDKRPLLLPWPQHSPVGEGMK